MKVKILKNCYVDGKAVKAGDEVDTTGAWLLIGSGKAEQHKEKAPSSKAKKAPANKKVDDLETR